MITKKLIKEIIQLDNLTLQDIEILKNYIFKGLYNGNNNKIFYRALKKYNQIEDKK